MKLIVARDITTADFISVVLGIDEYMAASVGVCPRCQNILVTPFTETTTVHPQLIADAAQSFVLDLDAFNPMVECGECETFVEPEWH